MSLHILLKVLSVQNKFTLQILWFCFFCGHGVQRSADQRYCSSGEWHPLQYTGCSGVVVEYRTRNREVAGSTHTRSTSSNLEQVANLLCAQTNSASYPQWDGKWVVATAMGWRPSVADWGDGVSVSCTVVLLSVSAGNGWPHNALRHHWLMPISCYFPDCKTLVVASKWRYSKCPDLYLYL